MSNTAPDPADLIPNSKCLEPTLAFPQINASQTPSAASPLASPSPSSPSVSSSPQTLSNPLTSKPTNNLPPLLSSFLLTIVMSSAAVMDFHRNSCNNRAIPGYLFNYMGQLCLEVHQTNKVRPIGRSGRCCSRHRVCAFRHAGNEFSGITVFL
ncbi:hypothetical protein BC829DRAFT_148530 [Chytridium lagenaria]|nr:hypothetical protein BC829DRAFT_148530 [Chytridium lagenaria]